MNLQNSSIRTFTVMDAKNTLIYSTVSLSGQFSSNISILPCTISSLSASFHISIQFWRTDDRSCCFLRIPYSAQSNENDQQYTQYPIWVLCTGEPQMSEGELKGRTIVYFRILQAILQPHEFRPPWSYSIYPLSVPPDWLCSVLCTAEEMIDQNPQLLSLVCQQHCLNISDIALGAPDADMVKLLHSQNSPGRLLYQYLKSQVNEFQDQSILEILMQALQVVFINGKLFGVFSGQQYDEQSNAYKNLQIDGLDAIVLSVLQQNQTFMGEDEEISYSMTETTQDQQTSEQLEQNPENYKVKENTQLYTHTDHPTCILDKLKQMSLSERPEENVVESINIPPQPLIRVLQLRFDNQMTSCVVVFKNFNQGLSQDQNQPDYEKQNQQLRITSAYIFKIDSRLHKILTVQCGNDINQLMNLCSSWVSEYLSKAFFDFKYAISNQITLIQKQPELLFSLQNIINSYPGILYFQTQNVTKEITVIPDIDSFKCTNPTEYQPMKQFAQEVTLNSFTKKNTPLPYNEPIMLEQLSNGKSIFYGEKRDIQAKDILKLFAKDPGILKQQQLKLQQLQYDALKTGLTYVIESDNDVTRFFCVFYYFCGPQSDLHGTVTSRTGALSQQMRHLFSKDPRVYPVPISRQSIMELNQNENITSKRRMTYSTTSGGWINTPQYWKSFDSMSRSDVLFKKEQQSQYQLFALQAAFLAQVDVDDVPYIANDLFQYVWKQLWAV